MYFNLHSIPEVLIYLLKLSAAPTAAFWAAMLPSSYVWLQVTSSYLHTLTKRLSLQSTHLKGCTGVCKHGWDDKSCKAARYQSPGSTERERSAAGGVAGLASYPLLSAFNACLELGG